MVLLFNLQQTYNLEITGLFYGNAVLYDVGSNHTERLVKRYVLKQSF